MGQRQDDVRADLVQLAAEEQIDLRFVAVEAGDTAPSAGDQLLHDSVRAVRGREIFTDLLFVLTHQRFAPELAAELWREILEHKCSVSASLGRNVGVAVAALDYLSNIRRILERPMVIDEPRIATVAEVATRDGMTGLYDHSTFQLALKRELARSRRYGDPLAVVMLDLDHFKRFNDSHGHPAGDRILARVGAIITDEIRDIDTGARYGGEEFVVVAPSTDGESAVELAERLRRRIAEELHEAGITVSVGVGTCPDDGDTAPAVVEAADAALYRAKREGRNRTACRRRTRAMPALGC
jgi:diguanylate cyclase (GGDEF)-like protein